MSQSRIHKLKKQAEFLDKRLKKYEKRIQRLAEEAYNVRQAQEVNVSLLVRAQETHDALQHKETI